MRAYKVKTNIEVNRKKGDGVNDFMARKNPIQASPGEAEKRKEENKVVDTSETFSASDAPELVVFIQESDYQSIKDIFIDREIPWRSRLKYHTDVNGDNEEAGKSLKIMSSISNEIEQGFQNYVRKKHALENLMKDGYDGRDDDLHDKSVGKMTSEKDLQIGDSVTLKSVEPSGTTTTIHENINHLIEVSSNSEAESGSTIHLSDYLSSSTTTSSLEEGSETEDRMSRRRSLTGASENNIVSEIGDDGDCGSYSIAAASPLSGPSSVSLRSTSSTASSHSFAFPILPSEWNGSPVRMAEADLRRGRKRQSWRTCFLCCMSP